ncbi:MAG TPA: alpha/beta fold hydrolase [Longimicrobiales bacterium]|nr:alpha/beta fold hydrolase [Longimicrobiales bacterium]
MRRARGWVGLTALALATAGMLPAAPGEVRSGEVREVWVSVDGRTVRALCTDGSRRVLLLHDAGAGADAWRAVLARLDGAVGACAYDRLGTGGSGPAPEDRGWFELEDEMRRIHRALGFERGYTLVGHGLAGLYARLYAADRPTEVGALVLVDPAHEDMPREVRPGMPAEAWEAWMAQRRARNSDGVSEAAVAERARGTRLPRIPVTVITATRRVYVEGLDERFLDQAAHRTHASVLKGLPIARHIPARSSHDVPLEQPDLVVDEILRVVRISSAAHGR